MFGRRRPQRPDRTTHPPEVTREHVLWAYRLLLDREPENEAVVDSKLAGASDTAALRRHFTTSAEFLDKNRDYAHTNERTLVIKELDDGVRLFVDLSDHVIGLAIVRERFEQSEIRYVRELLRPGDSAVDVGAHIGFFTVQMAALVGEAGRVHAFEPLGRNGELLERSLLENGFSDRVVFHRAAVGSSSGTATLTLAAETLNTGGAYLLREGTAPLPGNSSETVPVVALDDLPLMRPVRLIKMDVEGAEPQVLAGAERLLREDRPVILSELHPVQLDRASGVSADAFLRQVDALGYRPHVLDEGRIGAALNRAPSETLTSVVLLPRP